MKPNLFNLATKELSQDAFIAWLLQWASPDCIQYDPVLQSVASQFAMKLISLQRDPPESITEIEAGRQWDNIDVWAEVNKKYLVIVEDKTGTREHSNQLEKYRRHAEEWCRKNSYELVCVYLKTQSDSIARLDHAKEQGFAIFTRHDFLAIIEGKPVKNEIFNDFKQRLREVENSESEYTKKPIGEWAEDDWKGFYQAIERMRTITNWEYVHNKTGGFWNLNYGWLTFEGNEVFLMAESKQGQLRFMIGEVYANHGEVRSRFHQLLMEKNSSGSVGLQRPGRFGNGTYMAAAFVPRADWLGADNELVDMEAVVKRLNKYEKFLEEAVGA